MKKWTPQGRKPTFHVPIILFYFLKKLIYLLLSKNPWDSNPRPLHKQIENVTSIYFLILFFYAYSLSPGILEY
jgi:hypothetical protein